MSEKQTKTNDKDNIRLADLGSLSWKTPEETEQSLGQLYRYAEKHAGDAAAWYWWSKKPKAMRSRGLRLAAILLTTFGGLAPLINAVGWLQPPLNLYVGQAGYVLLGLAAACVGLDRFFGYSSGWMRYVSTAQDITKTVSEFRMDWAMMLAKIGNGPPATEQVQQMIQRIKEFVVAMDHHVEKETQTWIAEFKTSLADIEKNIKAQAEAERPGAIEITVTNGMDTDGGFTVMLDGMAQKTVVGGTRYQIGYVPPGPHKITVTGAVKGKLLEASEIVTVPPGVMAKATLALPVEEAQP